MAEMERHFARKGQDLIFHMTHKPFQRVFAVCSRYGVRGAAGPLGEAASRAFAVSAGCTEQPTPYRCCSARWHRLFWFHLHPLFLSLWWPLLLLPLPAGTPSDFLTGYVGAGHPRQHVSPWVRARGGLQPQPCREPAVPQGPALTPARAKGAGWLWRGSLGVAGARRQLPAAPGGLSLPARSRYSWPRSSRVKNSSCSSLPSCAAESQTTLLPLAHW